MGVAGQPEGCGFCKPCIRIETLKDVGRTPEHDIECVYRHIFDSIDARRRVVARDGTVTIESTSSTPPFGSCGSDCRWVSLTGSSKKSSGYTSTPYDDIMYEERLPFDPAIRLIRKRVQYSKRRSVK